MPNRQLTTSEIEALFGPLIVEVSGRFQTLASEDMDLHWALCRNLAKDLTYEERSRPGGRRALQAFKRREQKGFVRCAVSYRRRST